MINELSPRSATFLTLLTTFKHSNTFLPFVLNAIYIFCNISLVIALRLKRRPRQSFSILHLHGMIISCMWFLNVTKTIILSKFRIIMQETMPLQFCYGLNDNILNYLDDADEYQPHFDKLDWLRLQWYQLRHVECH